MDIFSAKEIGKSALDFHNSNFGFNVEVVIASFLIYKRVAKRVGLFVGDKVNALTDALSIQSNTLDGHSKKLDEHENKIENHEKRIVVLETKPKEG